MSIKRTPHRTAARRAQFIAVASGVVAVAALVIPATSANAQTAPKTFSAAALADASDAVLSASPGGIAWRVDKDAHSVVVTVDSTVSKAEIAKIKEAAGVNSGAIEVKHTAGTFRKLVQGGDAIYADSWRCSDGFNVTDGSSNYMLTAGHCTSGAGNWWSDSGHGSLIGPTVGSSFPTNDYGLIRIDGGSAPGTAGGTDITGAGNASVGMSVTRHGSTTGTHGGTVTGLDATVDYGGGDVVYGMIETNVCAEPGDSGGSLRSGSTAIGLTSGGSGDCTSGGTTFFQPVPEALSAYGVSVL